MREAFKIAMGEEFIAKGGRELLVKAQVSEAEATFESVSELLTLLAQAAKAKEQVDAIRQAFHEAANSPIGTNGKPRMLKLSAVIAHGGGKPNLNGDAFLDMDLKEAVDNGLFQAPYFGMIDFNHDFSAYGAWYSAKYVTDPLTGENCIVAEGAIFAWRYSDLADKMLAQQQRQGHIDVSMACIPTSVDIAKTAEGTTFFILRKPVFFTTSVLDVAPADPNARAIGKENTGDPQDEPLLEVSAILAAKKDLTEDAISQLEAMMTVEELIAKFVEALSEENQETLKPMVEAFQKLPTVEAALEAAKAELATATSKIAELTEQVATVTAASEQKDSQIEEVKLAKETAETKLTEAEAELVTLREFKASKDAEEAATVRNTLREARLAELNETATKAFQSRDEALRVKLAERWTDMEQEEWELVRDSLNAAGKGKGKYETASEEEGALAPGGAGKPKKDEIDAYLPNR